MTFASLVSALLPLRTNSESRVTHMRRLSTLTLLSTPLLLSGCAGLTGHGPASPAAVPVTGMHGSVHGGRQPIAGASIQLYQTGTTGYGTGATGLISGGVLTDGAGMFTFTGLYSCTSGSQVYLVSAGGNPGSGTNNSATLMVALGLCDNLNASTYISMNEITTVAAVWALSPFMNPAPAGTAAVNETGVVDAKAINIGAPATNQNGLANAFADANALVNTATGYSPGIGLPSGTTIPTSELNTLADILASCVNSTGSGDSGNCDTLFGYTPSRAAVTPADTIDAAINMARNPGVNVSNLVARATPTAPYQPTLATMPDLTVAITFSGIGINSPTAVAVDASGNIWIANSAAGANSVTKLSHSGVALSGAAGYVGGSLSSPAAVAIDTTGNAWIANAGTSTLTELTATGTNAAGSPFSGAGLSNPSSIGFDGLGNLWVSNSGNNSASEFSSTGTALSPSSGYTGVSAPIGVAVNPH